MGNGKWEVGERKPEERPSEKTKIYHEDTKFMKNLKIRNSVLSVPSMVNGNEKGERGNILVSHLSIPVSHHYTSGKRRCSL